MLGALASVYGKEDGGADTAVWLTVGKDNLARVSISIAHQTIEGLRGTGLLDGILVTKGRISDISIRIRIINAPILMS